MASPPAPAPRPEQNPLSLVPQALVGERRHDAPSPIPVEAWVPFATGYRRVNAQAIAWTSRAVLLVWGLQQGSEHRTWVWANAVRRRPRPARSGPALRP